MDVLALSGSTVDHLPRYAVVVVAVAGLVLAKRSVRWAFVAWLAAVCFLPVWAVITVKVDLEPHVVASLGLLICLLPVAARRRGLRPPRFAWGDALFLGLVVTSLVPLASGRVTSSDLFVLLVQWSGAFLVGRLIGYRVALNWIYGAVAAVFTVVAVLALVEYATGFNPFVLIPGHGALHQTWASIQMRGGRPRSEGAFGSSIALGCCLALAAPVTLSAPFRPIARVVMIAVQMAATVVTFSRIGLICAVIGTVLTVTVLGGRLPARLRAAVVGALVGVSVGFFGLVNQVFTAAGTEASGSAGYRLTLLQLIPDLRPFGYASSAHTLPSGQVVIATIQSSDGALHSIDNALLLVGLTYGWVPLAFVLGLLALGLGCLLAGRAAPPTIAAVSLIPAFATVALITQYSTVAWFFVGLAIFTQTATRGRVAIEAEDQLSGGSPEMVGNGRSELLPVLS